MSDSGAWFPTLDHAIGGTADAITGLVSYPFELAGDAAGAAAGGIFGGMGDWLLKVALLAAATLIVIEVI
jgi:hypothetical protein